MIENEGMKQIKLKEMEIEERGKWNTGLKFIKRANHSQD